MWMHINALHVPTGDLNGEMVTREDWFYILTVMADGRGCCEVVENGESITLQELRERLPDAKEIYVDELGPMWEHGYKYTREEGWTCTHACKGYA